MFGRSSTAPLSGLPGLTFGLLFDFGFRWVFFFLGAGLLHLVLQGLPSGFNVFLGLVHGLGDFGPRGLAVVLLHVDEDNVLRHGPIWVHGGAFIAATLGSWRVLIFGAALTGGFVGALGGICPICCGLVGTLSAS